MQRYFIYLSYNGKNYHGWQVQPNAVTVQGVLNHAFSCILQERIEVVGAGRTDTGVHASLMVAHVDIEKKVDSAALVNRLNSFLPNDIAIWEMKEVCSDAHARFDAISRTYHYFIITQKNPFKTENAYRIYGNLDMEKMQEACQLLYNYTDFTSFSKLHTDVKTNNCVIKKACWQQLSEKEWVFEFQADRFLRNMVRATVGTLLEVGKGRISVSDFKNIIEAKDRSHAGMSVPAHALFLVDIAYPETIFL